MTGAERGLRCCVDLPLREVDGGRILPGRPRYVISSGFRGSRFGGDGQVMVRNPELYAKGAGRWDRSMIVLHGWHRVLMNTEQETRAMPHVAFID